MSTEEPYIHENATPPSDEWMRESFRRQVFVRVLPSFLLQASASKIGVDDYEVIAAAGQFAARAEEYIYGMETAK